jgi:hypothetical protein
MCGLPRHHEIWTAPEQQVENLHWARAGCPTVGVRAEMELGAGVLAKDGVS